jgi:hypothetical protein
MDKIVGNIGEMLSSKKFKMTIFAVLGIVFVQLSKGDAANWAAAMEQIAGVVMVYLGAQGIADFGKSKAVEETKVMAEIAKEETKQAEIMAAMTSKAASASDGE